MDVELVIGKLHSKKIIPLLIETISYRIQEFKVYAKAFAKNCRNYPLLTLPVLCISERCIEIKAFIKPFEAPQGSVKMKIEVNFFFLSGIGTLRVKVSKKKKIQRKTCMKYVLKNFFELTTSSPMAYYKGPLVFLFSGGIERDRWHEMG